MIALATLLATAEIKASPELGKAAGLCRSPETGPAIDVTVEGLKDRKGLLRLELYPPDDRDFLADDKELVARRLDFARVDAPVPPFGPVQLCIRAPRPGTFTLSLMHDRDANLKFSVFSDGVGFPGNPRLGWSKPPASDARVAVGSGITHIAIRLNYLRGLRMKAMEP